MNIKAFFIDALSAALELNIASPEDVLRHVTPDVLAEHLPRPLWARLLAACLGAPRVDARLVVETIGVPNLCEHMPAQLLWTCIADVATRALGTTAAAPSTPMRTTTSGRAMLAPPPDVIATGTPATATPVAIGPSVATPAPTPAADQPLADLITELEQAGDEQRPGQARVRSPTAQRFRQSNTATGRPSLVAGRRPQAMAAPVPVAPPRAPRRHGTEVSEAEPETAVQDPDWRGREIAVDDSQLVDWQSDSGSAAPITGDEDFSDLGRKR